MELSKNLLVPIIPKPHEIIETNLLALFNHEVEHDVVEFFIVLPITIGAMFFEASLGFWMTD
jgi:hypothetical protein